MGLIFLVWLSLGRWAITLPSDPWEKEPRPNPYIHAFYYMWYRTLEYDGQWQHWDDFGRRPPEDIASSYYPLLGPYSSSDPKVMARHLDWLSRSHVGTLIISFWGQKEPGEERLDLLAALSRHYGIRWSFLIESYPGITPNQLIRDIHWLVNRYGSLMFHRTQATPSFPWHLPRPVIYLFNLGTFSPEDWNRVVRTFHTRDHPIMFIFNDITGTTLDWGEPDGLYSYTPAPANLNFRFQPTLREITKRNDIAFIATVSPGFQTTRYRTDLSFLETPRNLGQTYDQSWQFALSLSPDWVTLISFNEWHEGTQLEPAHSFPLPGYEVYNGDYGLDNEASPFVYMMRTRAWIRKWEALHPETVQPLTPSQMVSE